MYPSRVQYKTAVMNEMFPVDQNGGYSFEPVGENGEPLISAGGNATVFKVKNKKGEEYAIKLFAEEIEGRFQRLQSISEYFEKTDLHFFTHFQFVKNLIYVDMPGLPEKECYFPGMVMHWIEGDTLEVKLKELVNQNNQKEIKLIAEKFKDIALRLHVNDIAHGDLKLSNILITRNLELFLIDYDGMFLPGLTGQRAQENGTPSYQHPKRTEHDFNSGIDHFSILNIYTSLLVLSERPDLYGQYNDGDNILFSKEDFEIPQNSKLFQLLDEEKIQQRLLYYLKRAAEAPYININDVDKLIQGIFPVPKINITHFPQLIVVGQTVSISWNSENTDFVTVNDSQEPLSGSVEVLAAEDTRISFKYGTSLDQFSTEYLINAKNPPAVREFKPSNLNLKFDEPLVLSWKVEHSKKVLLTYDVEEIDVTGESSYQIPRLLNDTTFNLVAEATVSDFRVNKELVVNVYFPIKLAVAQERNITFTNRPVKLLINCENAESIVLKPLNIDLTGKNEFEIRTENGIQFQVLASNKRYIETFESFIDVLRPPSFDRKISRLSIPKMNLPPLNISLSSMRNSQESLTSFEKKVIKVSRVLNKLNIFKITANTSPHARKK
jgi:serine/threonine protein kinase